MQTPNRQKNPVNSYGNNSRSPQQMRNIPQNQPQQRQMPLQQQPQKSEKEITKKGEIREKKRKIYRYKGYAGSIGTNNAPLNSPIHKTGQKSTGIKAEQDLCREKKSGLFGMLEKFLPESVYNPKTKKILGLLTAEDLLLVALIFIFADSDHDDSGLMCLAILYLLISDYVDFSDLISL